MIEFICFPASVKLDQCKVSSQNSLYLSGNGRMADRFKYIITHFFHLLELVSWKFKKFSYRYLLRKSLSEFVKIRMNILQRRLGPFGMLHLQLMVSNQSPEVDIRKISEKR